MVNLSRLLALSLFLPLNLRELIKVKYVQTLCGTNLTNEIWGANVLLSPPLMIVASRALVARSAPLETRGSRGVFVVVAKESVN